jgi:hypothetical protein
MELCRIRLDALEVLVTEGSVTHMFERKTAAKTVLEF